MLRVFGMCGLGILFLVISAPLRQTVVDDAAALQKAIGENSPWSWVGIGAGVLALLMFACYRAAQPRS